MVQAIQVLRFHLLELEKVKNLLLSPPIYFYLMQKYHFCVDSSSSLRRRLSVTNASKLV